MRISRLLREEDGSTPFALLWFASLAMVSGFAVDTSNAWRHEERLTRAAGAAAHAGTVALARGASADEIREAAAATAMDNVAETERAEVFRSLPRDIEIVRFDAETGTATTAGDPDAVRVRLHRSTETGAPVRFLLLQVARAFSGDAATYWNVSGEGMAAITGRGACAGSDGIYSEGELDISSSQEVGSNVCFHGQDGVWMPQRNTFAPGSTVSMPDLDACRDKCVDSANPGSTIAAREVNLLPFQVAARIAELRADFLSGGPLAQDFFQGRAVDPGSRYDDLKQAGIVEGMPQSGDVIEMSAPDFEALGDPITGVTYRVSCDAGVASPLSEKSGGKNGRGKSKGAGLTLAGTLADIAVVTDCPLHVDRSANVRGVVIVATDTEKGVSADSFATLGAPGCTPRDRTTLASSAGLRVPAGFAGSNLDILVDGDVHLSGASAGGDRHRGLSLVAAGDVHLSAGHAFEACGERAPLQAEPKMIREVALAPF